MTDIAIIGAGMAGLTLANQLKHHAQITVFEKARGVGGRMSTRYAGDLTFDHGAQYFTARSKPFIKLVDEMIAANAASPWHAKHVSIDGKTLSIKERSDQQERYVGSPTMHSVIKHLSKDINIELNCPITQIKKDNNWRILSQGQDKGMAFDWVISTAPPAQTTCLFPEIFAHHNTLSAIDMQPCFALMLGFESPLPLGFDTAHVTDSEIDWIAVNSNKPNRNTKFSVILHSTSQFATNHLNDDKADVQKTLCKAFSRLTGLDTLDAPHTALHRWLYAKNTNDLSYSPLIDNKLKLSACGDWSEGGRVEGAYISACKLATKIKREIT